MNSWFISDQWTANSRVIEDGPAGHPYAFALIPAQTQFAQVYLNQYIPRCSDPPPRVNVKIRFRYKFTGDSQGCAIRASVNRENTDLFNIQDAGGSGGAWQTYAGPVTSVQLTYDPIFQLKMSCTSNTANKPAIEVTDISVY